MFTLVTWNTLAASLTKNKESIGNFKERFIRQKNFLEKKFNQIDIICLAEIDEKYESHPPSKHVALAEIIQQVYPLSTWLPLYLPKPQAVNSSALKHGNLILLNKRSKINLEASFPLIFSSNEPYWMNQSVHLLLLKLNNERFWLCFVHLKAGRENQHVRNLQIDEIIKNLPLFLPIIFCGDFNQQNLPTLPDFNEVYENICSIKTNTIVPCNTTQSFPKIKSEKAKDLEEIPQRLDYIFYRHLVPTKIFSFNEREVIDFDQQDLSDHFPVGASFILEPMTQF